MGLLSNKIFFASIFVTGLFCSVDGFAAVPVAPTNYSAYGYIPQKNKFVNYYDPKVKTYVGVKGVVNFVSHSYYADNKKTDSRLLFGQQVGFELNVGRVLSDGWRTEINVGMLGNSYDKDSFKEVYGLKFRESAYYVAVNGIHKFGYQMWGGPYLGAGAGLLENITGMNMIGWRDEISFSPMAQFIAGYEQVISGNWLLDLGAKTFFFYSPDKEYAGLAGMKIKTGFVWNITIGAGIKYKF
jgi:hypothetical protein